MANKKNITIVSAQYYNSIWNQVLKSIAENLRKSSYDVQFVKSAANLNLYKVDMVFSPFINETFYDSNASLISKDNYRNLLKKFKRHNTKLVSIVHEISSLRKNSLNDYYQIGFKSCSLLIHLTEYSKQNFSIVNASNIFIPHPFYENISNSISKTESRKKLFISPNAKLILSFGNIRNYAESNFLVKTLKELNKRSDFELITTRFFFGKNPVSWKINKFKYSKLKYLHLNNVNVKEDDLQIYFNAADIIILPRIGTENLNSGVIYLASYFKKIIVGPSDGNIGYILKSLNLPRFNKNDQDSILKAIKKAFDLSVSDDLTTHNFLKLQEMANTHKIANIYCLYLKKVLE